MMLRCIALLLTVSVINSRSHIAISAFVPPSPSSTLPQILRPPPFGSSSCPPDRPVGRPTSLLEMERRSKGSPRAPLGQRTRSKRQERVQTLVRTELASIISLGHPIRTNDEIRDSLRRRISIVMCDVSPDLRQCRVTVSVSAGSGKSRVDETVERREAFAWLVQNTVPIRHALAKRMSHMRGVPNLTFAQADVGAAVDVMYLIDKVSKGAKRRNIGEYGGDDDEVPEGMFMDLDFDYDDEDDFDWEDDEVDEEGDFIDFEEDDDEQ